MASGMSRHSCSPPSPPGLERSPDKAGADDNLLSSRVLTLATLMRRSASLQYRDQLGLSQNDWTILAIVGRHPPLSLSSLAELILLDQGQLSRAVTGLVERDILLRRPSARGGREIEIALTDAGTALHATLLRQATARNAVLARGLTDHDRAELVRILDVVTANARGLLRETPRRAPAAGEPDRKARGSRSPAV